jgi:hypothetical protein
LELGDVERSDEEAVGFDAGECAWKRGGENDRASKLQGIGGMGLGGIDVDPIMASECLGIEPGAVREQRIAAEIRDGGFEMKATGHRYRDDFIVVGRKNGGKLADAFGVAALGEADKEFSADAQDIATFESAGKRNGFELAKLGERLSERRRFAAAGFRAKRQNHGQFIEDDGGVFDERGVGKIGLGGKRNNAGAQVAKKDFVRVVLLLSGSQIDGIPTNEGKFAIDDGRADGTCDGCEHFDRESLHEYDAAYGNTEVRGEAGERNDSLRYATAI